MSFVGSDFGYSLETYPGIRKGILEGLLKYRRWLKERDILDLDWSCVMPTRYGKSDFIRTAAIIGLAEKLTGPTLVVHPAITLARQLLEKQRMDAWERRWKIYCRRPHIYLSDFGVRPFQNNEWIGSINIQALIHNLRMLSDFCKHLADLYGVPPVLAPDETHQYTVENRWGDVPRTWMSAGGIVLPMTATPFRSGGDELIGFHREVAKTEEYHKVHCRPHPDPDKVYVVTDVGEKTYFKIEADHEVPPSQAWAEKAVSRSTVDWIDVRLEEVSGLELGDAEDSCLNLKDIPRSKVARLLSTVCRDPKVIRDFAGRFIKHLHVFWSHENTKDATGIIYGLNDAGGRMDNAHLLEILKALQDIEPKIRGEIATMKINGMVASEDEKAVKRIEKFTDPAGTTIDVLLLKMMGNAGLDSDRIKVVGTLDTVRSANAKIQQWGRGANVWGSCRHYVIVTLEDVLNKEIYENHIKNEGGEATEIEVIESWEEVKDKKGRDDPIFVVKDVIQSGAADSDGGSCTPQGYSSAFHLLEEFPGLAHDHTFPQLAEKAIRLGLGPVPDVDGPRVFSGDSGMEGEAIVDSLNEAVKAGARLLFRRRYGRLPDFANPDERNEFGGAFKPEFIRMLKATAGVHGTWDQDNKDRIRDLDALRRLFNVAEQLLARMRDETP